MPATDSKAKFIAAKIQERMQIAGSSPQLLAAACGVETTLIRSLLLGRAKAQTVDLLNKIAFELNCSLRDLAGPNYTGEPEKPKRRGGQPGRFGKQIQLRISDEQSAFVLMQAAKYGSSINSEIVRCIVERMDAVKRYEDFRRMHEEQTKNIAQNLSAKMISGNT